MGKGIILGKSTFLHAFWLELGESYKVCKEFDNMHINSPYYVKIMTVTKAGHLWRVLKYSAGLSKAASERPTKSAQLSNEKNWNVFSELLTTTLLVINNETGSLQQSQQSWKRWVELFFFFLSLRPDSTHSFGCCLIVFMVNMHAGDINSENCVTLQERRI